MHPTKSFVSMVVFAAFASAIGMAQAAVLYVVPWYANPAVTNVTYSASLVSSLDESAAPVSTAWATVSGDANVSGQTIVAKRMSHTDYFRPRLYALRDDGTLVIYTLTKDLAQIKWTTVYASADLIARVNANGGSLASGQTVTGFEVVDKDGAIAFVQFGGSGDWTALANKQAQWTYYDADEAGNPAPSGITCLTDGNWVLKCRPKDGGRFYIGTWTQGDSIYLNGFAGECLDLSAGQAKTTGGTALDFRNCLYSMTNSVLTSPRIVLYPAVVETPNGVGLQSCRAEELVFACPKSTGWPQYGSCTPRNRVVIDLPKVTSAGQYAFSGSTLSWGDESDFGEFYLPKLATIAQYAFQRCMATGTLSLPAAATLAQSAFYGCNNMEEAILGTGGNTLSSIATKAFAAEGTQGSLKRVTLGCAAGLTISVTDIFNKQPLEVVTFTGAVPTISAATAWPDAAANTMVFVIPEGDAAWASIASGATLLTDAERKAYHTAHPDHPIPFGTVAASVFKTHYAQYVAYSGSDKGCALKVERNTFFDDTVSISTDWTPFADGTYPKGTVATITATPNATGTFKRWYGDVDKESRTSQTITVTLTDDTWLYARIVHPWTLAADKATATDGNFTVNCSVLDESKRTLTLGAASVSGLYASSDTGSGIIDLGGTVTKADDGTVWTFSAMPGGTGVWGGKANVEGLLFPGTLANASWGQSFNGGSSYRLIILDEPFLYWNIRDWYFVQSRLSHIIIDCPDLQGFTGQTSFWRATMEGTKFDWWDLSSVEVIHANVFMVLETPLTFAQASGTISLPSMRDMAGAPLRRMTNLEGVVLGGKTEATTVTNIVTKAFELDTSLKKLVLYNDADIEVGATPFLNGRTPDEIVFMGLPPNSPTVFANLFAGIGASDTPRIMRIPKGTQAWMAAAYIDTYVSAAEKALAGAEADKVFGVYRGESGGTPFVKALCVWDEPMYGFRFIIR